MCAARCKTSLMGLFAAAVSAHLAAPAPPPPPTEAPAPPPLEPPRWGRQRARAIVEGPDGKRTRETPTRDSAVDALIEVILEAALPAVAKASRAADPATALRRCGAGRRNHTIRMRLSEWNRAQRFPPRIVGYVLPASP